MKKVILTTPQGHSEVKIAKGLVDKSANFLKEKYPKSKFVIVTDSNLYNLFERHFRGGRNELVLTVPAGEKSKTLQSIEMLAKQMLEAGITRNDIVIGVGGGMITDLAGFLASIYMRGLKYISIPTSLLAMVDASVGGKTGVDLGAKNVLGTFYLADYVLIDLNFIETLPENQVKNGLGEAIKYGYSLDPTIIDAVEAMDFESIVLKCIKAKAKIVEHDFKEGNKRKLFNYGHTFGHAIEAAMHYKMGHGQCVTIGMCISDFVAQKLGKQTAEVAKTIKNTLIKNGLPTQLPKGITIDSLADLIRNDKKRSGDSIDFAMCTGIGKSEIQRIKIDELIELAKDFN